MKKATKVIRDTDKSVKIPVYLNWSEILLLKMVLRKYKESDRASESIDLLEKLQLKENDLDFQLKTKYIK